MEAESPTLRTNFRARHFDGQLLKRQREVLEDRGGLAANSLTVALWMCVGRKMCATGTPKENYRKIARMIPRMIMEILATLNLWFSVVSKMMVDEMWNRMPMTIAVISTWNFWMAGR